MSIAQLLDPSQRRSYKVPDPKVGSYLLVVSNEHYDFYSSNYLGIVPVPNKNYEIKLVRVDESENYSSTDVGDTGKLVATEILKMYSSGAGSVYVFREQGIDPEMAKQVYYESENEEYSINPYPQKTGFFHSEHSVLDIFGFIILETVSRLSTTFDQLKANISKIDQKLPEGRQEREELSRLKMKVQAMMVDLGLSARELINIIDDLKSFEKKAKKEQGRNPGFFLGSKGVFESELFKSEIEGNSIYPKTLALQCFCKLITQIATEVSQPEL